MGKKKAPSPRGQLFTFPSIWRPGEKNKMLFDWSRPGQGIKKSCGMRKQDGPHTDFPGATGRLLPPSSQHPGQQRARRRRSRSSLFIQPLTSLFLSEASCPPQVPCHERWDGTSSAIGTTRCVFWEIRTRFLCLT